MASTSICFTNVAAGHAKFPCSPRWLAPNRPDRTFSVLTRCRSVNLGASMLCDFTSNSAGDGELQVSHTGRFSCPTEVENWFESPSGESASAPLGLDDSGGSGKGWEGGGSNNDDFGANDGDDELPDDIKKALAYGSITRSDVQRYLKAIRNPFLRLFLSIPGFRTRFIADSAFCFKLLVQEIIGNGTALAGEIAVRGKEIVDEVEYVASDLIVGTVIEAAFVWLLAPTMRLPTAANASALSKYFAALPSNFFQPSSALVSFTITQRIAAFFYAAVQYAAIGLGGGIVGTAITYSLLEARKLIDSTYKPVRPMPPVIPNSLGWAAFMGVSANTRFQLVEGLELGVTRLLTSYSQSFVNSAILVLRFLNNYWGGVQFVRFFRAIGLHATAEEDRALGDKTFNMSP